MGGVRLAWPGAAMAALLCAASPAAARERWTARLFTTADGLSQSGVTVLARDADGYLWIGTQDGLDRYDGARFVPFFREDGLPSNFVDALLVDRDGRLWVGTQNGVAVREGARFRAIDLPADVAAAMVSSLAEHDGAVYAAAGPHLVRIDRSTRAATVVPYDGARGPIAALATLRDGTLLVGTQRGILRLAPRGALEPWREEALAVRDLAIDARGDVWIATEHDGLFSVKGGALAPFGEAEGLHTQHVDRLTGDDGTGAVLVGTFDDGAYRIADGRAERVTAPKGRVGIACADAERTIWAADFGHGGLLRLERAKFETVTQADGLPTDEVYGIHHARDGSTWIATATGLVRSKRDGWEAMRASPALEAAEFTGIAEAPDGTVCAGTLKKGVVCFANGVATVLGKGEGLPGETVDDLIFDRAGRLWLATNEGIAIVEKGAVTRTLGVVDGLLDATIYTLYEDRAGAIWIGYSYRSGLSRWDGERLVHYGEAEGLPHGGVTSVLEDARGDLWVTSDGGLAHRTDDRFRAFSKKDGLPSDEVYVALEDSRGALWLSTDDGVAKFEGDRVVETFTVDDGLAANEGQSRGGAKDAAGRLWFASTGGVTIVDPDHVRRNEVPPRVLIEKVEIGGRAPNDARFEFTATSFRAPRAMRFAYRLDGFDQAWTTMEPPVLVRAASYTNLPPGDYAFEVRATNDDGVWCAAPAIARFRVPAPWWRTPWAIGAAALSLVGLGYAATMLRLRGLRRRAALLEDKVAERTRELAEKNLLLDQQLEHVRQLNQDLVESNQRADRIFSALTDALPGKVLDGKYRLDDLVGSGGFGVVFRATHLDLRRTVAVKVFRPQPGNDSAEAVERFRREAISASHVQHPNAVAVFDSGVSSDGIAYLVMELLEGESLADRLRREARLSLRALAAIVRPLCAALDAAHAQGVVHRDIKPENVFLHRSPEGETVKVVDFGVARLLDPNALSRQAQLTATDAIIGTPAYIAPERLAGDPYDGKSDVFSVGVIAYEALTGHLPYEGREEGLVARIMKQLEEDPTPLHRHVSEVPIALEAAVMRAMARDPALRPTAIELADAVDEALRDLDDARLDGKPTPRAASVRPGHRGDTVASPRTRATTPAEGR